MATQVVARIDPITREILFETPGASAVELDGGLWTLIFKMPEWFGQEYLKPLSASDYAITVNYSQNDPMLYSDGYTDQIVDVEWVEDPNWERSPVGHVNPGYVQFYWTPPAEATLNPGWLFFNIRIRDRTTNGIWSTKTKKVRVNPIVTGGGESSLTPTQKSKVDELLDQIEGKTTPVLYGTAMNLTPLQKTQARDNIDSEQSVYRVRYSVEYGRFIEGSYDLIHAAVVSGKLVQCAIECGLSVFYAWLTRYGEDDLGSGSVYYYSFDYITYQMANQLDLWYGSLHVWEDNTTSYDEGSITHAAAQ